MFNLTENHTGLLNYENTELSGYLNAWTFLTFWMSDSVDISNKVGEARERGGTHTSLPPHEND